VVRGRVDHRGERWYRAESTPEGGRAKDRLDLGNLKAQKLGVRTAKKENYTRDQKKAARKKVLNFRTQNVGITQGVTEVPE